MTKEHDVKLQTLREVRDVIYAQERRFTASRILAFNKYKYLFGVLKSYITVYVFGFAPQIYWRFHAVGLCSLVPVQIWRWRQTKQLLYMIEFCWLSSFLIGTYLMWLNVATGYTYLGEEMGWWAPQSDIVGLKTPGDVAVDYAADGGSVLHRLHAWYADKDSFREGMALLIFGSGVGPLGFAVVLLNNALVPHSVDHSMSLMIHLHNLITSYCLLFKPSNRDAKHHAFGGLHFRDKAFAEYVTPPLAWFALWWLAHTAFMQLWGVKHMFAKGCEWNSSPRDNLAPPSGRPTMFTKLLGRADQGDGKDHLRALAFSCMQACMCVAAICGSFLFYKYDWEDGRMTFWLTVAIVTKTAVNGANWYNRNVTKFTSLVDGMIAEEEKKE